MQLSEYAQYDGLGLAALVRSKQVTAKELGRLFLDAVAKVNPQINAVIEAYAERVERLDDNVLPIGPFAGVPLLMKDLGAGEQGQHQAWGSRLCQDYVVAQDAYLTKRFRQAGFTLLGRTTTPEMGLSSTTESVLTGATRNPWNLTTRAGGSSGGAAASVAAGILPIAHASDGAGSIRIPSSVCGLVGLKPSRGRVSLGPDTGETLMGMGVEFAICRTVRDVAALLDAVAQPAPGDPFVIAQPARPYVQEVSASTGRLKIAWTKTPWKPGVTVHPEIAHTVAQVAQLCTTMGHEVEEVTTLYDYETFVNAVWVGWAVGFDLLLESWAAQLHRPLNETTLEPVTLSLYHLAKQLSAADVARAEIVYNQVRRVTGALFQQYDLLLTPTVAQLGDPIGKYSQNVTDVDFIGFFRRCDESDMYLPLFNLTGQPAISLPLGQSSTNLPIGVQFVARFGDEATLLRLASALETALSWQARVAPVHISK